MCETLISLGGLIPTITPALAAENIISVIDELLILLNQEGNIITVNKATTDTLQYGQSELVGKSVTMLFQEDNFRAELSEKITKGEVIKNHDSDLLTKNGKKVPIIYSCSPLINREGIGIGTVFIARDITEHKQAEEALKQANSELQNLHNNLDLAVFSVDVIHNKMLQVSIAHEEVFGYSQEAFFNNPMLWYEIIVPEDKLIVDAGYPVLFSGKNLYHEYRIVHADGQIRWIEAKIKPTLDTNGKLIRIDGIASNITERKQAEEDLIKANEHAEASDRLKSAFLTNMSHEIRTPMNGILGFAELLKEPNLSIDEQQDFIQTIEISGARMLNTINSIVDISKIESGLIKVDIKETNINEKMEFTYKFFKPEVEIKGLQFLFKNSLPLKEAIIKTDNEKVCGILTNLVRNAIKFTYEGSIEFGYVLKSDSEPAELEFFVKDTGIGIPQEKKQLIFERFMQGSESHNRGYEGSGLGLSIAKSYVEMLGGEIWMESEEGKGSTFYFTIPYNAVSEGKTEIINAVSTEHKEVQLKNLKILIVEDDEISYSLLTRMLHNISTEVLHAITGVEAIESCRKNPDLDLVLMDIRMPVMDGLEATRQIRQFNKDVLIIAQTAFAFAGEREKAIDAGCNDYISKPINKTLLIGLILKHFNN